MSSRGLIWAQIYDRRYTSVREVSGGWDKLIEGEKIKIRIWVHFFFRSEDSNDISKSPSRNVKDWEEDKKSGK